MTIQFRPSRNKKDKQQPATEAAVCVSPGGHLTINGKTELSSLTIHVAPSAKGLTDPLVYAPAIPGVLVALVGLLVAHWLSGHRDRRKELSDLCSDLKKVAEEAASLAMKAWELGPGNDRLEAIRDTKRKLSILGTAATHLSKRTPGRKSIDLNSEVARLRKAATNDPFEDPQRHACSEQTGAIMLALADILSQTDEKFLVHSGS
ncbi:hypothetical protein [Rhodopseudomonas palustris]|uniref:hypothetical protein n=1 Tax=Rhodopseudomonas palustris TaxID=1076 RepID=UPI0021F2D909|nr:hypothetical protein [Rhodopseudomonas palustris]UYO51671.1 hypothetical protein KQX61_13665 [Rhodopseudomonas palustris]